MPKAITTRFYGATPTRPARVTARAEGVPSLSVATDLGHFPHDDAHRAAAEGLRDRMGWKGALVAGVLPDARTRAFVFCDAVEVLRDAMGFLDVGDVRAVWAKKGETQALMRVLNRARLIVAALRPLGITFTDEAAPEPAAPFRSWRDVRIHIETRSFGMKAWAFATTAGDAFDNNDDEPCKSLIRAVALGEHETATFGGGGAGPEVLIRRAPAAPALVDGPLDGRVSPLPALLAAARNAEWIMSRALSPDGAAPTDMERHRDALRAAIAQAEAR